MRKAVLAAILLGSVTLVSARHRASVPPAKPITIDPFRSLVVTDPGIVDGFDFERVLRTLIDRSGATATTPLSLFRQWFDTQNPKPGLAMADAPHCDDFLTGGKPSFNGFPRRCPTPEGVLATADPFPGHEFTAIGITNRFDLAPLDGSNCGQYRLIFARTTVKPRETLHIIVEAVLPNPKPSDGLAGCRAVAQFWADLSGVDSMTERRARIQHFFFDGIDGFAPVLRPEHFGTGAGRIRTLQVQPDAPSGVGRFYQFQLLRQDSRLLVVPGLLEDTPYGPLLNAAAAQPLGPQYRQHFLSQIATLAIRDVNGFFEKTPDQYLIHESFPEDGFPLTFNIFENFKAGASTAEGQAFNTAIAAELQRVGSSITVNNLMDRAMLQNCHGCHVGLTFAIGDGIVFIGGVVESHVTERQVPVGNATRFEISPGLRDVFAPNRARILSDFLAGKPLPVHSNGGTVGGGRSSE
jgi:hypothetical protein